MVDEVAQYQKLCVTYNWNTQVCGDWREKKTWQVEKCMVPRCKAARKPRGGKSIENRKSDK